MKARIILLFMIAPLIGCNQEVVSSVSSVTSDLVGSVGVIDYRGRNAHNKQGVLIQCLGTPYSCLSDSSGHWILHNLPTRSYSIKFSKEGYISWLDPDYEYIAGVSSIYNPHDIYGRVYPKIVQPPRYSIMLDAVTFPKRYYDSTAHQWETRIGSIYGYTSPDTPDSNSNLIAFYFGHSPAIGEDTTVKIDYIILTEVSSYSGHDTSITINTSYPMNGYDTTFFSAFHLGDTVYVRAYPAVLNTDPYNPVTGEYYSEPYKTKGSNVLSGVVR